MVLEAGSLEIKVLAGLVSGEASLPGLQTAALLCSNMALLQDIGQGETKGALSRLF